MQSPRDVFSVGREELAQREELKVWARSVQGRRRTLEDRYVVLPNFTPNRFDVGAVLAVFDGHGGSDTAQFCCDNFQAHFLSAIEDASNEQLGDALRATFLSLDAEFALQHQNNRSGSTALVVCVDSGRTRCDFANVGDCAVVIVNMRDQQVVLLNDIHNTENEEELERIQNLGGLLISPTKSGPLRVEGSLCITRSLGDNSLKQYISGEPETNTYDIQPCDKYIILASDGFYDAVPYEEVAEVLEQIISTSEPNQDLAELLCEEATRRDGNDNITVICILLH